MKRTLRIGAWAIVALCGVGVCAQALMLWRATRLEGYAFTRYYDDARAARETTDERASVADLFAETGLEEHTGAVEDVPNRFMLGMLPGGSGKHAISVLTLGGPGALVALIGLAGALGEVRRSSWSEGRGGARGRTP